MMLLTKHKTADGPRWAVEGYFLPPSINLSNLLEMQHEGMHALLSRFPKVEPASGTNEAPIDPMHEVWAAGVTYLRSRDARKEESTVADMYQKVYDAERPELFSKSLGWRVVGNGFPIRIRKDSAWDVPEPELVLVINRHREIVGYCAGNDVSSRSIEGENPLYLPQAKIYDGACVLGPGIQLCGPEALQDIPIRLQIHREDETVYDGSTYTTAMKRTFLELVEFLTRELDFPQGVFLMTGTGLVPGDKFTLKAGDVVCIQVGELAIENRVLDNSLVAAHG